jgi:hypothetical protein
VNLRATRLLPLLALVAPALAVLPLGSPATAAVPTPAPVNVVASERVNFGDTLPADRAYRQVAVGYSMTYGLRPDGAIDAVGPYPELLSPPAPPSGRSWVSIAAGGQHGLALDSAGHVATWGFADDRRTVPATVPPDIAATTFQQVVAGSHHDLGLTTDGRVVGWGTPSHLNELAIPAALTVPDQADPVVQLATAYGISAAVTASGQLHAWGSMLGTPPDGLGGPVAEVSAGRGHLLVRTVAGDAFDWGVYTAGPMPDLGDDTVVDVEAGYEQRSAAITEDGQVVVWGQGEGQLPTPRDDARPVGIDLDRSRGVITYGALTSTAAPTIDGAPRFGDELTATPGTWSEQPDDVHFEWRAHDRNGGSAVVGTDAPTYTPTAQDAWDWVTLSVTVTATKDGFVGATATSEQTANVAQRHFAEAPEITVTGEARVGGTLTATATSASPLPDEVAWGWYLVDRDEEMVERIDGTASGVLTVTPELEGKTVSANVTVTKEGYEPAFDQVDLTIAAGTLAAPRVSVSGRARVGQTLTAAAAADPAATRTTYQWLRSGAPIAGAVAGTYRVTAADLGSRLSVRTTSTAPGYTPVAGASASTPVVTLGAARLRVVAPSRVTVGRRAAISVRGLAANERFTVRVGGRKATGTANASGTGKVRLKIAGKPGRRPVVVVGSVADRAGKATLRVVRRR